MTSVPLRGQAMMLEVDGHPARRILSTEMRENLWLCGVSDNDAVINWLENTARHQWNRRKVKLTIIDQVRKSGTMLEMFSCVLTEVTLPALDKASSADAVMRLRVQPEKLVKNAR